MPEYALSLTTRMVEAVSESVSGTDEEDGASL